MLLGQNTAPNAVVAVLHALVGCMTVSFSYPATAQGIRLESPEYTMGGDVDLHGFLNLSNEIRPGLQNIRVRAKVKADAPTAKIQELLDYASKTSPVMDTLRNPMPGSVELAELFGREAAALCSVLPTPFLDVFLLGHGRVPAPPVLACVGQVASVWIRRYMGSFVRPEAHSITHDSTSAGQRDLDPVFLVLVPPPAPIGIGQERFP